MPSRPEEVNDAILFHPANSFSSWCQDALLPTAALTPKQATESSLDHARMDPGWIFSLLNNRFAQ